MNQNPPIPRHLLQGAKSRKTLASEYRMSDSTFYRRLKKAGIQLPRHLLLPEEYRVIYQKLGLPTVPPPPRKVES